MSDQPTPAPSTPAPPPSDTITFEDFTKVKLRVAKVVEAVRHPNADKLLVLQLDVGGQRRQICAGLVGHYTPEELVGKNIIIVANLAPRMMRGQVSEGMLLAAGTADRAQVIVLAPERDIASGSSVS